MRHALLPLVLLLAFLAGCASSGGRGSFSASGPLSIAFSRSGGLTGESRSLLVAPDGEYKVERDGRRLRRGTLTRAQQASLRDRIGDVRWDRVAEVYPDEQSRDAYAYALSITTASGAQRGVAATDVSLQDAPPAVAALMRHLGGLLDEVSPR